jgi:hypothetical protein
VARRTIRVSDISGKAIEDGAGAVVTIRYDDARRGQVVLDATVDEVAAWAVKGAKQARRGRKPKAD